MKESLKPLPTGSGDVAEQQLSESDDEASVLPVAPNASSLRPGIVHRLDKGTTGSEHSNTTKQGHNRRPSQLRQPHFCLITTVITMMQAYCLLELA